PSPVGPRHPGHCPARAEFTKRETPKTAAPKIFILTLTPSKDSKFHSSSRPLPNSSHKSFVQYSVFLRLDPLLFSKPSKAIFSNHLM
ncbi:MAG: hypothetical protein ACPGAP_00720, partial [Akkermansiaceae bacterium]